MQMPLRDIRAQFDHDRDAALSAIDDHLETHPDDSAARLLKVELCLKAKSGYPYVGATLTAIIPADDAERAQIAAFKAQAEERAWEILNAARIRMKGRFTPPGADPVSEFDQALSLCPDHVVLALSAALALLRANGGTTPFDEGVPDAPKPPGFGQPTSPPSSFSFDEDDDTSDESDQPAPPPKPPPSLLQRSTSPFSGTPPPPLSAAYTAAIERYLRQVITRTQPGERLYEVAVVCLIKRWLAIGKITVEGVRWMDTLGEPPPAWRSVRTQLVLKALTLLRDTASGFLRSGDDVSASTLIAACEAGGVHDDALAIFGVDALPAHNHAARAAAYARLLTGAGLEVPSATSSPTPPDGIPYHLAAHGDTIEPLAPLIPLVALADEMMLSCRVCGHAIRPSVESCPFCETRQKVRTLLVDRLEINPVLHAAAAACIGLAEAFEALGQHDAALRAFEQGIERLPKDRRASTAANSVLTTLARRLHYVPQSKPTPAVAAPAYASESVAVQADAVPPPVEESVSPALLLLRTTDADGVTADIALRITRLNEEANAWTPLKLNQRAALVRRLIAAGQLRLARETVVVAFADSPSSRTAVAMHTTIARAIDAHIEAVLNQSAALLDADKPEAAIGLLTDALILRDDPRLKLARAEARIALGHDLPALGDLYSVDGAADADLRQRALKRAVGILEMRWDLDGTRALLDQITDRAFVIDAESRLTRRERGEPVILARAAAWQVNDDLLVPQRTTAALSHAYFAVSLREVGIGGDEAFYRRLNNAQIEFIQVIGAQREMLSRAVFALRFISEPHPHVPARGRVRVALLARVSASDDATSRALALTLWNDLNAMLPMSQENVFVYEPVVDTDELEALLIPFAPSQTAEIARRESGAGSVYSVSSFMSGTPDLHNVHWMLLRQPAPAMISFQIMPTSLYAWERPATDTLSDMMAPGGESPFESVTPSGASINFMKRQLAQQQQWQKLNVADQRLTYLQNGFILRVYVAGAPGTSQLLPEMAAAALFAPLQDNGFNGGYQVLRPSRADEMQAITRNLDALDIARWEPLPDDSRLARLRVLVSEGETAALFRLPIPHSGGVPGMTALEGKALVPPAGMPANGARLGVSVARVRGVPVPITQGIDDRRRHSYVVGKTGMGKSTLLQTLILQDIDAGRGVFLLDPHGDLCDDVLARIPAHRKDDVILFDPSDEKFPIGLNILRADDEDDRDRVVSDFIGLLIRMYDPHNYAIVGPIFQQTVRNAMLAAMCLPDGTLVDVYRMISDQDGSFVKKVLPHITDPIVKNYWDDVAKRMRDASSQWKAEFLPYVLSKFSRFIEDATLRRMIGQKRSGVPFEQVMDEGKILLVNLAKGKIGEQNALFIGSLILSGIMQAAFKRGALPPSRRRDFFMYIDEVQNFATPTLATMLSEGRKFGVVLTIANQYLHQLNAQILEAVFGNIGSILAFRLGIQDVGALGMEFHPAYAPQELSGLPQFTAAVKLLIDGVATRPFTMRTLPSMVPPNQVGAELIRAASQTRYGTPIAEVEAEIGKRFTG